MKPDRDTLIGLPLVCLLVFLAFGWPYLIQLLTR